MSDRPAALGDQEIEFTQPPGKKRRWSLARIVSHQYRVYPGTCKRSVASRVPTYFRPESPYSRRKTLCFQYVSRSAGAKMCPQTANSGLGHVHSARLWPFRVRGGTGMFSDSAEWALFLDGFWCPHSGPGYRGNPPSQSCLNSAKE